MYAIRQHRVVLLKIFEKQRVEDSKDSDVSFGKIGFPDLICR